MQSWHLTKFSIPKVEQLSITLLLRNSSNTIREQLLLLRNWLTLNWSNFLASSNVVILLVLIVTSSTGLSNLGGWYKI